jgi:hypothetical protein
VHQLLVGAASTEATAASSEIGILLIPAAAQLGAAIAGEGTYYKKSDRKLSFFRNNVPKALLMQWHQYQYRLKFINIGIHRLNHWLVNQLLDVKQEQVEFQEVHHHQKC